MDPQIHLGIGHSRRRWAVAWATTNSGLQVVHQRRRRRRARVVRQARVVQGGTHCGAPGNDAAAVADLPCRGDEQGAVDVEQDTADAREGTEACCPACLGRHRLRRQRLRQAPNESNQAGVLG